MSAEPNFLNDLIVAIAGAFVGSAIAVGGAFGIYLKTRKDEREKYAQQVSDQFALYERQLADQRADYDQQRQDERTRILENEQAELTAARTALLNEIDANLAMLGTFWAEWERPQEGDEWGNVKTGRWLVMTVVPVWSLHAWRSISAQFLQVFTQEELRQTAYFYRTLSKIDRVQNRLEVARQHDIADLAAQPTKSYPNQRYTYKDVRTAYFNDTADELIPSLSAEIEQTLAEGNPIAANQ